MKYFTFYRESNKFDDILKDNDLKRHIKLKISWYQHLMVGLNCLENDSIQSIITLKYSDDMVSNLTKDFTPVTGIDYIPKKDKNKFQQVQA